MQSKEFKSRKKALSHDIQLKMSNSVNMSNCGIKCIKKISVKYRHMAVVIAFDQWLHLKNATHDQHPE